MAYRINLTEKEISEIKSKKQTTIHYKIRRKLDALLQLNKGVGATEVARGIGVSNNSVTNWIKEYKNKGLDHFSKTHYPPKVSILDDHQTWLTNQVQHHNIRTMSQLRDKLKQERGLEVKLKWLQKYCKKNLIFPIKSPA